MTNPWVKFGALTTQGARTIATVSATNGDGSCVVTLRGGGTVRVQGDGVDVGDGVIIQRGQIIGKAPNLPVVNIAI